MSFVLCYVERVPLPWRCVFACAIALPGAASCCGWWSRIDRTIRRNRPARLLPLATSEAVFRGRRAGFCVVVGACRSCGSLVSLARREFRLGLCCLRVRLRPSYWAALRSPFPRMFCVLGAVFHPIRRLLESMYSAPWNKPFRIEYQVS